MAEQQVQPNPPDGAVQSRKRAKGQSCTYEEKIHILADDLRTELLTAVNMEICDEAFGAILGNPGVDPGPRLSQLLWDVTEGENTLPRPDNVPSTYELPPQDWPRFSEENLTETQQAALAYERRQMEKYLLRNRQNFKKWKHRECL